MNTKIKISMLLLYFVGLIALYLFSADNYSWMYEKDPSIAAGSISNNANDSKVITSFIFVFLMAIQIFLFVAEKKKGWKITALLLALVAVFLFIFR